MAGDAQSEKRTRRAYASTPAHSRRGVSSLALVLGFALIVSCVALAVDVGLLVQRHQQLKTAGEASALAGALNLFDALPVTIDQETPLAEARKYALTYAAENSFNHFRLALDANQVNRPRGDIVVGTVDPLIINAPFHPAERSEEQYSHPEKPPQPPINAILVRTRHSQAGGRGPILFFGSLVGVPSHDVYTESIAAVERRLNGYRPVGCSPVPMLPFVVISERWEPEDLQLRGPPGSGDHGQEGKPHDDHKPEDKLDKFTYDPFTREVDEEPDGIPEIEIVLKTNKGKGNQGQGNGQGNQGQGNSGGQQSKKFKLGQKLDAQVLQFVSQEDEEQEREDTDVGGNMLEQVLVGLTAADLANVNGQVMVGDHLGTANQNGQDGDLMDGEELQQALAQIVGQPRLLLLGSTKSKGGQNKDGKQSAVVEDFAAGVVVKSLSGDGSITIRIQPVVLNSCTGLPAHDVKSNPWIGKVMLVR